MRKRNVHIQFWLDKNYAEALQKKFKKSGLSREAYLRHLVNGLEPQDAPPPDYYAMMRELRHLKEQGIVCTAGRQIRLLGERPTA